MYEMNAEEREERAKQKKLHTAIRMLPETRVRNLAWGFIRGFKFRRIERNHHFQPLGDQFIAMTTSSVHEYLMLDGKPHYWHNAPSASHLHHMLTQFGVITSFQHIVEWLKDRDGAIPVPVREKKALTQEQLNARARANTKLVDKIAKEEGIELPPVAAE